jgi:hypothetical protein
MTHNSIRCISPYKWNGLWVFDDPNTGLEREAFVAGADVIIDQATAHIRDAANGFILLFSDNPFPNHQVRLDLVETLKSDDPGEIGMCGSTYQCQSLGLTGWLCPSLYLYFASIPQHIYTQFKSI